jgi:hypothetical protein
MFTVQHKHQCQYFFFFFVNTAMKLRFPHKGGEFLEQLRNCKLVILSLVTVTLLCNYGQEALHKSLFEI